MSIEILQADCKRALNALVGNYDMSNTELDEIVNNDEKIEELISGMDEVCFFLTVLPHSYHFLVLVVLKRSRK